MMCQEMILLRQRRVITSINQWVSANVSTTVSSTPSISKLRTPSRASRNLGTLMPKRLVCMCMLESQTRLVKVKCKHHQDHLQVTLMISMSWQTPQTFKIHLNSNQLAWSSGMSQEETLRRLRTSCKPICLRLQIRWVASPRSSQVACLCTEWRSP